MPIATNKVLRKTSIDRPELLPVAQALMTAIMEEAQKVGIAREHPVQATVLAERGILVVAELVRRMNGEVVGVGRDGMSGK
jgi:hypothetical protein